MKNSFWATEREFLFLRTRSVSMVGTCIHENLSPISTYPAVVCSVPSKESRTFVFILYTRRYGALNPVLIVLYFPLVLLQFSAPSVCDPHEHATFGRIRAAIDLLDHSVRRLRQSGWVSSAGFARLLVVSS